LVLGIVSFVICPLIAGIAAIITGTKGKRAVDRSGGYKTGRGMALAGQILGWINVVISIVGGAVIALVAVLFVSHPSYTSLKTGDCFNPQHGALSGRVSKVSCANSHKDEVVGTFYLPDGSYPGESGLSSAADRQCSDLAQAFVGPAPAGVGLAWEGPNRSDWDGGTRKMVCAVENTDGSRRTGSLRGAGGAGGGSGGPPPTTTTS
jgi:hypothetical protein